MRSRHPREAKGTLYLYFKSKREVYLRTLQHGRARLVETMTASISTAEGMRGKLRALIAACLADENRDFMKIYLTEFCNVTHAGSMHKELRSV